MMGKQPPSREQLLALLGGLSIFTSDTCIGRCDEFVSNFITSMICTHVQILDTLPAFLNLRLEMLDIWACTPI